MMPPTVTVESGFAEVPAGTWLVARSQPAACFGDCVRRRRKGWVVRDRGRLDLVETAGTAKCADSTRPFLTHIPCAAPIFAVSDKVLVAPAAARSGAEILRPIPFSVKASICVTNFAQPEPPESQESQASQESQPPPAWVVMATTSRTARTVVPDGETLSVRPESAVAWTGRRPSGFCPKLGLWDMLLPRGPKNLLLRFHGPCLVWLEGSGKRAEVPVNPFARRAV
jgi:hypothetical protein